MTEKLIQINGASGGGRLLRAVLALSIASGKGFAIERIRENRPIPGLMRKHLAWVRAARELADAAVEGEALASASLVFIPRAVGLKDISFDLGSAGSIPAVMAMIAGAAGRFAARETRAVIRLRGGTLAPEAPAFEFARETLLPELKAMGYPIDFELMRPAFQETGGGEAALWIEGAFKAKRYRKAERPDSFELSCEILLNRLPPVIAEREAAVVREAFGIDPIIHALEGSEGPGNAVIIRAATATGTTVFTEVGRPGMRAETVAADAVREAKSFLERRVPVSMRLSDQLIVPLAAAGGGAFLTSAPSVRTRAAAAAVAAFCGSPVAMTRSEGGVLIEVPSCL